MIAYDTTLLDNTFLMEEATHLKNSGFINSNQYKTIEKELPILKSQNNILFRLGFLILGSMLYSSICGLFTLLSIDLGTKQTEIFMYVYAIIGMIGIEFLAKQKYYGYGLDDAFLLGAQMLLFIGVGISTNGNFLAVCMTITFVSIFSYIRYIHVTSALLTCIGITGSVAYLIFELGTIGKSILPFVMMTLAITLYFLSIKAISLLKFPYHSKGIQLTTTFSLILFYLSGNYLIVRELSIVLLDKPIPASKEIPFAYFFYLFTFIVPIFYLVYSLYKKDKPMLWIGFLGLVFSFYTIRYYYPILPIESVLTISGLLLFICTYFTIKKIKNKESGITFLPDRFSDVSDFVNLQALIVTSQFGIKPEAKIEESPMEFGGGTFSGGGSSGEF